MNALRVGITVGIHTSFDLRKLSQEESALEPNDWTQTEDKSSSCYENMPFRALH